MECDFENTMACLSQSWNWLEKKESKNDKISRRVWEAVETKAGKVRIAEAEKKEKK